MPGNKLKIKKSSTKKQKLNLCLDTSNFKIDGTDEDSVENTIDMNRDSTDQMSPFVRGDIQQSKTSIKGMKSKNFNYRSNSSMDPCKYYELC